MGTAMCSVLAEEAYSKRKSCSPSSVIRPLLLATAVIQIAAADLRSKTLPNDRAAVITSGRGVSTDAHGWPMLGTVCTGCGLPLLW